MGWSGNSFFSINFIKFYLPFELRTFLLWQTLGNQLEVDGRFRGKLNVTKIDCNTGTNTCVVPVRAPGFALVYIDSTSEALSLGQATETFATTAYTQKHNTVTYEPSTISLSNGHSGGQHPEFMGTSPGDSSSAVSQRSTILSSSVLLLFLTTVWAVKAFLA